MPWFAIGEDFDAVKPTDFGLLVCQVFFAMHLFLFKRGYPPIYRLI